MQNLSIDISVFIECKAIGYLSGSIDFFFCPNINDTLTFWFDDKFSPLPSGKALSCGCKVEERVIQLRKNTQILMLSLGDLTFDTEEDALHAMSAFESEFGLFFNKYEI